jgi:hypothetical protein
MITLNSSGQGTASVNLSFVNSNSGCLVTVGIISLHENSGDDRPSLSSLTCGGAGMSYISGASYDSRPTSNNYAWSAIYAITGIGIGSKTITLSVNPGVYLAVSYTFTAYSVYGMAQSISGLEQYSYSGTNADAHNFTNADINGAILSTRAVVFGAPESGVIKTSGISKTESVTHDSSVWGHACCAVNFKSAKPMGIMTFT